VIPEEFHRFFWDCRPAELDVERNAPFIMARLLEHGDVAAARWVLRTYGPQRIRTFVLHRGRQTLSRKTIAFWRAVLRLEDEPCLQPSSLRHSRPFWNV
jgi:hypothetical protein